MGSLVFWLLYITFAYFNAFVNLNKSKIFTHSSLLDIVWTILPAIVLLMIAALSFSKKLSVTLFYIASVSSLANRAHCAPGDRGLGFSETSTYLPRFKNFLEKGYSYMGDLILL